ncbi:3-oxoacyl-ACP reductase FabG [Candidatus Ishikawella capsulata]|uniref:3-oxoacyl-[acyl-carrier-protein] reductase n=1 Tax=Candidatus Ishikawaella capsulata Mpkobe TaxID=476281 RepID=C5WD17_9ENTR|nr:3-oxoacyl-ACP reductase FabG [Candidatus Ishikawaella capsulata]BAH83223.1 3-oxoacyl-[acyl-carrier-protein] reductase [Candidatus Ishikawaella capsulata Mpkobe]
MSLMGKIALVTGASRGIGKAIVNTLAARRAKVIGTATTEIRAKAINNLYDNVQGVVLNMNDPNSIIRTINNIRNRFGEIDILVNNAGIIRDNLLIHMKEDDWQDVLEINLSSVFRISKAVVRSMIKKRNGRIINISSVIGIIGNTGQTNYTASKAGVIGFSKALAHEIASCGITVNVVAPGFIKTDMTKSLRKTQQDNILARIPIGRFGNTQEVANAVAFLASDEAAYITGETLHVNGGMCMV